MSLTVIGTVNVGAAPYAIATDDGNVWVTDQIAGGVTALLRDLVYGTMTTTTMPTLSGRGAGIAHRGGGNQFDALYVAHPDNHLVWVGTDDGQEIAVPGLARPMGVAVAPAGDKVYVTDMMSNSVAVVGAYSHQVVDTIPVGSLPQPLGMFIQSPIDRVPDPFAIPPVTGVAPSSPMIPMARISKSVVLTGFEPNVQVSIDCPLTDSLCGYSIAGGAWTKTVTWVAPGTSVRVRVTPSLSYSATTQATLHAGPRSATFSVTTKALAKK